MYLILAALVAFLAVEQSPAQPAGPTAQPGLTYQVGAGDVLSIKVFAEPDLSNNYNVDSDGSLTFPFIGRVDVNGKTLRAIETQITKMLAGDWVRKPQVTVEIERYRQRSIFVLGEVRNPGKYFIEGQVTLLEVIAKAGSLTTTAGNSITLLRYKDGNPTMLAPALPGDNRAAEVTRVSMDDLREGRATANLLIQDGDTLYVPAADKFYVTGFVKTPGQFVLVPNLTVRQAIAIAGGLTERGSTRRLKIVRRVGEKEVEIDANMSDPVKPNDTIKVSQRLI